MPSASAASGTILYVCTANLARSPLAAALLRHELHARGRTDVLVESAGTHASPSADNLASVRDVAREYGLDLAEHRARQVTRQMISSTDLVLTMTEAHRAAVVRLHPAAVAKTFTVLELQRLLAGADPAVRVPGPSQLAEMAHRQRPLTPEPAAPEDVEDPIGRPVRHLRRLAAQLQQVTRALTEVLEEETTRSAPRRS